MKKIFLIFSLALISTSFLKSKFKQQKRPYWSKPASIGMLTV